MGATYYSQILNGWLWQTISDGMDKVAEDYRELGWKDNPNGFDAKVFDISFWAGKEVFYPDADEGDFVVSVFIGRNFQLAPSGKYYMPWSTNITEAEAEKDTRYWVAFEKVLDKFNMYGDTGEGDPTDLFIKRQYHAS